MRSPHARHGAVLLVAAVLGGLLATTPPSAASIPSPPSLADDGTQVEPAVSLPRPLRGAAALRALRDRVGDAARLNGLTPTRLKSLLENDSTTWLSTDGRLYYVDSAPAGVAERTAQVERGPYPYDQTFTLHSKPGSLRTIFLDFDGATVSGTQWNAPANGGLANGSHPAWDPADNGPTFTDTEKDAIQSVWQRVAEDYAPFDVDVTTQDPGDAAILRSGAGDEVFGTRALITPSAAASSAICGSSCGGVAFIDVFDDPNFHSDYQPAWIFPQALGPNNPKYVAEAVSHEVGHNMGLEHHGKGTADYYGGHGVWAPIMGNSYAGPVSQWSNGSYTGATRPTQDDVAVIAGSTHAERADETGSTLVGAVTLPSAGTTGYVTSRNDVDVYGLGTCSGTVTVTATAARTSPNLDIQLRVRDAAGTQVAVSNPTATRVDYDTVSGMSASVSQSLASGRYFAEIDGVGNGTVNTGYDDYGSLGAYTLTQTGCSTAGTDTPSAPQSVTAVPQGDGRSVLVSWSAPAEPGTSVVTGYQLSRLGAADLTTSATSLLVDGLDPGTSYSFALRAVNGSGAGAPATAFATTYSPPGAPSGVTGTLDVGAGSATLTWQPPASSGGVAVSGYEVAVDGDSWASLPAAARSHTFTGLSGDRHTLAVRAVNSVGAGTAAETVVSTASAPSAVTGLAYSLRGTAVTIRWSPPASDGGSPLLRYEVDLAGTTYAFDEPGVDITGLTRGATVSVAVRAVNAVGAGPTSSVRFRVPTAPGSPRIGAASSGARGGAVNAVARWSPPTSNGGASVTGYQVFAYQLNRRDRVVRTFSTSALAPSLRRATVRLPAGRYRFAVRARNAAGWGRLSSRSAVVTAR